jgi:hypothetical protein
LEESSLCAGEDFVGGVELLLVEAFVKFCDERFEVGHGVDTKGAYVKLK